MLDGHRLSDFLFLRTIREFVIILLVDQCRHGLGAGLLELTHDALKTEERTHEVVVSLNEHGGNN